MLKRWTAENGANEATWHREPKENVVKSFEEEKKIKEQSLQSEPRLQDDGKQGDNSKKKTKKQLL